MPPLQDDPAFFKGQHMALEDFTSSFISGQMTEILKPFARSLRELQGHYIALEEAQSHTDAKANQNRHTLDQILNQDFQTLQANIAQLTSRADRTQSDISLCQTEQVKLSMDHSHSKGICGKLKAEITSTIETMRRLTERQQDLDGSLEKVKLGHVKSASHLEEQAAALIQLEDWYKGINHRYTDMQRELTSVQKLSLDSQENIAGLVKRVDSVVEENVRGMTRVSEHVDRVEMMLGDSSRNLQRLEDRLRASEAGMQQLRKVLDNDGSQDSMLIAVQRRTAENVGLLAAYDKRLEKLEDTTTHLRQDLVMEMRANSDSIQGLCKRVAGHSNELRQVEETQLQQGTQVKKMDWNLDELQKDHSTRVQQADVLENNVNGATMLLRETSGRTDAHALELNRVRVDLELTNRELGEANTSARELSDRLDVMGGNVHQLAEHYVACKNTILGVSKGMHDCGRRFTIADEAVLPMRPSLPRLTRPTTAGSARSPVTVSPPYSRSPEGRLDPASTSLLF